MLTLVRKVRLVSFRNRWHTDTSGPQKRHNIFKNTDKLKLNHLIPITTIQKQDIQLRVSHSIDQMTDDTYMVNLAMNADTDSVKPAIYVCCLDATSSLGKESTNSYPSYSSFSERDLVNHSMNTIIRCLRPIDKLAIVPYNENAKTIMKLTNMNEDGKKLAMTFLRQIHEKDTKNLWSGLNASMNLINNMPNDIDANVFLLVLCGSAGIGNGGIIKKFIKKNAKTKMQATVHVFGYGDELDSTLLFDLSDHGNGLFAHILDDNMCKDVLINYLSSTLVTSINNIIVKTDNAIDGGQLTVMNRSINNNSDFDKLTISDPINHINHINMGSQQSGQSRNLIWRLITRNLDNFKLDLNIEYENKIIPYQIRKDNALNSTMSL